MHLWKFEIIKTKETTENIKAINWNNALLESIETEIISEILDTDTHQKQKQIHSVLVSEQNNSIIISFKWQHDQLAYIIES